jgi:hypothetical protein
MRKAILGDLLSLLLDYINPVTSIGAAFAPREWSINPKKRARPPVEGSAGSVQ